MWLTTLLGCAFLDAQQDAKANITRLKLGELEQAVEMHQLQNGTLPANLGEITTEPALDGWEHPVVYAVSGDTYTLVSLGSDGKQGGSGHAADLEVPGAP